MTSYKSIAIDALRTGLIRHVRSEQVPPGGLLTATNVAIRNGALTKSEGWTKLAGKVTGTPTLIGACRFPSVIRSVIATNQGLWSIDELLNMAALTAATTGDGESWRADYLLGKWYFTTGTAGCLRWDGSTTPETFDTGGYKADDLVQFHNHLLLARIKDPATDDGPLTVAGSDLQAPEDFSTVPPDGDATLFTVADGGDPIQRVARLGDYVAIYKEASIHLLSYTGGDLVYRLDPRSTNAGLAAASALAVTRNGHYFMGSDDLYLFQGSEPQGFAERVWSWFTGLVVPGLRTRTFAFHNLAQKEVWFVFYATDTARQALVYNYEHNAFTLRDCPFTAIGLVLAPKGLSSIQAIDDIDQPMDNLSGSFAFDPSSSLTDYKIVAADDGGNLYDLSEGADANGTAVESVIETGDLTFGQPDRLKLCGGIDFEADLTGNPLQVYVSARHNLTDAVTYAGPYSLAAGARRINFLKTGRWFRFKFVKTGGTMTLRGFAPRIQLRGNY